MYQRDGINLFLFCFKSQSCTLQKSASTFNTPSEIGVEKKGAPLTTSDELANWVATSSNGCDRLGFLMLGARNSEESLL